jgi:hypothetical protein
MKTWIVIAVLLVAATGAMDAGAQALMGADSLKLLCPGCYVPPVVNVGTGSNNGESNLIAAGQPIAPMSRSLNDRSREACSAAHPDQAEGIVFGLDAISILVNNNASMVACNGPITDNCERQPSFGVTNSMSFPVGGSCMIDADCNVAGISGETCSAGICTYQFLGWRDVLRVLYAGMSHTAVNLAERNCGSPVRRLIANGFSNFFQSGCSTGACNMIQHAFRPNDESGTTDVFLALLDLPLNDQGINQSPFCNVHTVGNGTLDPVTHHFTPPSPADPFSGPLPPPPAGFAATPVPTNIGGVVGTRDFGPDWTDFQDGDVIRRTCSGNGLTSNTVGEDVCSARGDLGLVLSIWDAPVVQPGESAFPSAACDTGSFGAFPNDLKVNNCSAFPECYAPCPNGVLSGVTPWGLLSPGTCAYPVKSTSASPLDPRCLNNKANKLAAELPPTPPNNVDGRVYNLHLWTETSPGVFVHAKAPRDPDQPSPVAAVVQVPMSGAYYRIHQSHTLNPGVFCQQPSATRQLGCLVGASPCSVSMAAHAALNGGPAIALKLDGVDPITTCVQNSVRAVPFVLNATYPLSRKLYINTVTNFLGLAAPALNTVVNFAHDTAGILPPSLGAEMFYQLPPAGPAVPGFNSFCEDFDEGSCTGPSGGVDACKGNLPTLPRGRAGTCGVAGAVCAAPGAPCNDAWGRPGACFSDPVQGCLCF